MSADPSLSPAVSSVAGRSRMLGLAGFDEAPGMLSRPIAVPFTIFKPALPVELGFRGGTVGPSPRGPDALAKS